MALPSITVWKDRANPTKVTLTKNGTTLTAEEFGVITAVEMHYQGAYYSSIDYPDAFDLVTLAADRILIMKLGLLPLAVGADAVELIIYDAVNTDGIMWLQIAVQVQGDAAI